MKVIWGTMGSRAALAALTVAASVCVCAVARAGTCAKDTDCKGERVCEQGKCVAPAAPQPAPAPVPAPPPPPVAAPPAPPPPPPPTGPDVVYMSDGSELRGTVVKQELGKLVVLRMRDGSEQTLDWSTVKRVSTGPRPAGAGPDVAAGTTVQPVVRTAEGEAITFTFAPAPSYTLHFALGGFLDYAQFSPIHLAGAGLEIGAHGIIGLTKFPDIHGGSWYGIALQGFLMPFGGGGWGSEDGTSGGGGFFSLHGGAGAGVTYMHLNDADLDYHQRGYGFMATYRLGGQGVWGSAVTSGGSGSASVHGFAHGPWLAVIFPSYDAHRAALSYGYVNFNVVFMSAGDGQGDSATLSQFMLGGGRAF